MYCEPAEPEGNVDMYWNIPLDVSTDDEVDETKDTLMLIVTNDIMVLLSLKITFHGCIIRMLNMVECARFAKNIRTVQVLQEVLFQFAFISIRYIPTNTFKQHEKSGRHQRLEKKLYKSENELKEALQKAELSLAEKANGNTYITRCVQTIHYLIRKILQSTEITRI